MSNIKVVDINEDAKQSLVSICEAPEEVKEPIIEEEVKEPVNEEVAQTNEEQVSDIKKEEPKPEEKPKAEPKAEAKVKTQDKLITCPKCDKTMKTKSYRYSHEKICQGNLIDRPVKPKAKPKPKPEETPTPKPSEINPTMSEINPTMSEKHEACESTTIHPPPPPEKHPKPTTINPLMSHYQLLQQQYIKQKQERFNNLFQGMISGSRKKR